MENKIRELMNRHKKHALILICLLLASLVSLWVYTHIDPSPPYGDYEFWIEPVSQNEIGINDFQLFYDFNSQTGRIEFQIFGMGNTTADNIDRIIIDVPPSLKVNNYTVKKEEHVINDFRAVIGDQGIFFDKFNSSMEWAFFTINIGENDIGMYPNGRFAIHTLGSVIFSKFEDKYGRARVKFSLGKYSCDEPCFYDISGTESPRLLNDSMQFYERKQGQEPVRSIIFVIRTLDKREMILKEAFFAVFTGLIVGIVFLITEWVGKDYLKR